MPALKSLAALDLCIPINWTAPDLQLLLLVLQVINVDYVVTENHLGRIDMQLCDVTAQPGDNKCITLQR